MQLKVHLFIQRRMSQIKQWPLVSILLALTVLIGWGSMPASAQTEQSHWLGRPVGTEYVFDIRLPQDFADMLTASGPEYSGFRDFPEPSTQIIDGETYSFVTTEIKWDMDRIDNGQIAFARNGRVESGWWFNMDKESAEWAAVAQEVKAQATGDVWKGAELFVLIWPDGEQPTVRVPIPETTLARNEMVNLGQQTGQGLFYPSVSIPADLDAFRTQMLAYGNVGRRDPDFRKNNGSQTATDLSGDTVNTQGGTQEIFKQSQTPPYFADHVMTDELNRLAQFQAEYTASIQSVTHNGPGSFRDPNTGETVNMSTLGVRADHFGVSGVWEAAGGGGLGEFPHGWMVSETHFRPWFNVNGCVPEIGYGAAKGANGSWYFVAAGVTRNDDCLNKIATGEPTPAVSATPTPAAGSAGQGVQTDLCADIPASDSPSSATVRFVNLESVEVGIHVFPEGKPIAGDTRAVLRPGQTRDVIVYFDSTPYYESARLDDLWGMMYAGNITQLLEAGRQDITSGTPPCIVFGDSAATTAPEPTPDPAPQAELCAGIPASDSPSSAIVRFVNLETVDVGIHAYPYGEPMNGDRRFTLRPGQTWETTVYFDSNPYYDSVRLDVLWVSYLFIKDLNGLLADGFYSRQDVTSESPSCIVFGGSSSVTTPEPTVTPEPTPTETSTPVPPSASGDQPPPLISYTFTPEESKVLPGTSTEVGTQWGCSDTNTIADEDKIGRLAVVTLIYQTGCWTDGRYNHSNYQVERGQVTGANGTALEAYRVHPPSTLATNFLGSKHAIYYQFPSQEAYTVYTFDGSTTKKVLDVEASQIVANGYTKLDALTLSESKEPVTYIFAPSGQDPSVYTEIGPGVEAAQLPPTELGDLATHRFDVTGTPFDTVRDFTAGPAAWANLYSHAREFFPVPLTSGVGVIWQDQANQAILLTTLGGDLQSQQTLNLPNNRNELLAAATSDGQETLYYLTIQDGGQDQNIARTATLYRVNQQGTLLQSQSLDTSPSGLNISHFGNWMADMRLSNGQLGIMVARRLHRGGDGLQHQSGTALVYQADTLALVKNLGQTSGHSFDNVLITNQAGEFVGIDLGDNYPRGVHLHKFTGEDNRARSKVVYTFKTEHGTKSRSPAGRSYPRYSEISGGGITYYQWSNDNRTYTELGGVVEGANGYTVVFAGETAPGGLSLLNGRARGEELNDPRNVGLVQVRPDFESQTDFVLSQGVSESGGFYSFGGTWSAQSHKGIVWLTDYTDKEQENASRLKTVKLPDGNILLIWEKWTADSYVNTYAMKVSESGQKLTEPVELGSEVRLGRRDDPLVSGGKIYLFAGDNVAQKLIVTVLEP